MGKDYDLNGEMQDKAQAILGRGYEIAVVCEKCGFVDKISKLKLETEHDVEYGDDYIQHYETVSVSCPNCENTVELK